MIILGPFFISLQFKRRGLLTADGQPAVRSILGLVTAGCQEHLGLLLLPSSVHSTGPNLQFTCKCERRSGILHLCVYIPYIP